MHADADARRLRDVLEQVHLLPVESDAVDLVALAPDRIEHPALLDLRGEAIDQDVLTALGRVDELEALARIGRRECSQMVCDRATVSVVPILDPGHRLAGGKVLHLGAAPELGRRKPEIVAQCPDRRELHRVEVNGRGRTASSAGSSAGWGSRRSTAAGQPREQSAWLRLGAQRRE